VPVLAGPTLDLLVTDPDGLYVDGTVGGGGHSRLLAARLSDAGRIIGCDRDSDAIARAREVLPETAILVKGPFSEIDRLTQPYRPNGVTGVLLDLGISSWQIDTAARGFSHRFSGPLDLRMDPTSGESASELLERLDLASLTRILFEYGEEPQARRIAKAIQREREHGPITTTDALAHIISHSVAATRIKSLSRVFQALRIAVNRELDELEAGLPAAWSILKPGGRLVVISYHSLEDRIVKNFIKSQAEVLRDLLGMPLATTDKPAGRLVVKKPIIPDSAEILQNPRARSAKLRAAEKLT
jgi:16S rRNA (cytosine1402-N4)-methyltransferase